MRMRPAWIGVVGVLVVCGLADRRAEAGDGWARAIGGSNYDFGRSQQATSDGGYVLAGGTTSFGAGSNDAWCLKLDSSGNPTWQRVYGGSNDDIFASVQQTSDGGYIVAGYTRSFGAGLSDAWCLKLDSSGNPIWQKTFGGSGFDRFSSVQQTSDGGYIVAGQTLSFGAGSGDAWCLKLDSSGNPTWQKTYGGGSADSFRSVQQTSDGGYIVAGYTTSFGAGSSDAWCLKLDSSGSPTWQKTYGGSNDDDFYSVQQTSDSGYIVAGYTASFGAGGLDASCLKLDSSGSPTWQKTYGGSNDDYILSVQQTSDGGYVLAGSTESLGTGSSDALCLKLDSSANGDIDPSCGTLVQSSAAVATVSGAAGSTISAAVSNTPAAGISSGSGAADSAASTVVICASPASPDLTGTWSMLKVKGSRVTGTLSCVDAGSAAAGQFAVKVYLSKKSTSGKKATLVKTITVGPLSPGGSSDIKVKATKEGKHKYLVAVIDTSNAIAEEDETNNTVAGKL